MDQTWNQVLDLIKAQLSRASFETWFKPTKAIIEGSKWIILVPNEFSRDWLEQRYQALIEEKIYKITNEFPEITIAVDSEFKSKEEECSTDADDKVISILSDIHNLQIVDRERLFSLIQKYFCVNPLLTRETSKLDILVREVAGLKTQLNHLKRQIEARDHDC